MTILRCANPIVGTVLALVASSSFAAAQEAPACACSVPIAADSVPPGILTEVSGNVLVTQAAGYVVAEEGTGMLPGSRVVLGADGSALLSVGQTCSLALSPNSTATLMPAGQHLCVQVVAPQRTVRTSTSGSGGRNRGLLLGVVGVGALGAGIGLALSAGDDESAPVSD